MFVIGWFVLLVAAILGSIGAIHIGTGRLRVLPRWLTRIWLLCFIITIFCTSIGTHANRSFPFSLVEKTGFWVVVEIVRVCLGDVPLQFIGPIIGENIADFCLVLLLPTIPVTIIWSVVWVLRKYVVGRQQG